MLTRGVLGMMTLFEQDQSEFRSGFEYALSIFLDGAEAESFADRVVAIAFVTTDDLVEVSMYYRLAGDLTEDAEPFELFSPFEWPQRFLVSPLKRVNEYISLHRKRLLDYDGYYESAVRALCEGAMSALGDVKLDSRLPRIEFLTFCATDPNEVFDEAEALFVKTMNPPDVVAACLESWK